MTTGALTELDRDPARLILRALRLMAKGRPISGDDVDRAIADLDQARARELLDAWCERNADGDIVGLGLTFNPTQHQVTIDGTDLWAWCAMDTLIFAVALKRPVAVASTAPGSGVTVHLRVTPDGVREATPADAVVTWPVVSADEDITSKDTDGIWATFCHHSFFFGSRAEAEQWAAGRDDIQILSLDGGFEIAREEAGALLRHDV
jgi:alkylmercury lyase